MDANPNGKRLALCLAAVGFFWLFGFLLSRRGGGKKAAPRRAQDSERKSDRSAKKASSNVAESETESELFAPFAVRIRIHLRILSAPRRSWTGR